jgi:uncharacterized protein
MPSISEKLKSLGVHLGPQGISSPRGQSHFPIDQVIDGHIFDTTYGQSFVAEQRYPLEHHHGLAPVKLSASLQRISSWLRIPGLASMELSDFIFLDTETSGLVGGSGTLVFLIGVGRFDQSGFHLAQYFLRDPMEEPAQLTGLIQYLSSFQGLVTYNGKSFDIPLLTSRFILNGEASPFTAIEHLDLLPLARRLWRDRLPSRSLGQIEQNILGAIRSEEDVPGWLIPSLYFDYLRTGDARPLRSVFYHNAMDILAMAALLNQIAHMLETPQPGIVAHGIDLISLGKIFEDMGDFQTAAQCFADGLGSEIPSQNRREALQRWSLMEKRRQNLDKAIELWRLAANEQDLQAFIELAKHYEHQVRDVIEAIHWTLSAIELVENGDFTPFEKQQLLHELEHRLARLERKKA